MHTGLPLVFFSVIWQNHVYCASRRSADWDNWERRLKELQMLARSCESLWCFVACSFVQEWTMICWFERWTVSFCLPVLVLHCLSCSLSCFFQYGVVLQQTWCHAQDLVRFHDRSLWGDSQILPMYYYYCYDYYYILLLLLFLLLLLYTRMLWAVIWTFWCPHLPLLQQHWTACIIQT